VDAFGGLLAGTHAQGAFALRTIMNPPWCVRIQDEAPLSLVAVVRGDAWFVPDGANTRTKLGPGDVAILRGPDPYSFADDPSTPPQAVIHPGQRCTTPDGADLREQMQLGVRSWGNDPSGESVMLVGTYETRGEVSQRLLGALPPALFLRAATWSSPLVPLLGDEVVKDDPGQGVVLDRLLDLLVVAALRAWFSRPGAEPPAWYRAQSDPVVGKAIALLHHHPDQPWTVASLAAANGVSRAALARRFAALVGQPPIAFLTGWRLALAADRLREPGSTIGAVAREVGYGSPYALSTAFKRTYGISPKEHRLSGVTIGQPQKMPVGSSSISARSSLRRGVGSTMS
jgi:AraC-like DNA-binding protein